MVTIRPEETALLVIDMQNGAYHPEGTLAQSGVDISGLLETVPRIERLVRMCRDARIPDIWTRQIHYAEDKARAAHRITHHTLKRKRIAFQGGTWDAEIVDELKPLLEPETHILEKHKWSAFYGTRLAPLLRILGSRLLIVSGGTTNACVESTVRDAFMNDYDIVIVRDCVAGVNERWHEMALEVWQLYVGEVVSLADLERELDRQKAAA